MARGMWKTRVIAGPEWNRVERALAAENRALPARLHRTLKDKAEDRAAIARANVRNLPVKGRSGHTGLRQLVAAGVHVKGAAGFYRISTRMPSGQEIIPRGLDRNSGWSHPVYGNAWKVRQRPVRAGWFTDSIGEGREGIADALEDDMDDSAQTIASAGAGP